MGDEEKRYDVGVEKSYLTEQSNMPGSGFEQFRHIITYIIAICENPDS